MGRLAGGKEAKKMQQSSGHAALAAHATGKQCA